MSALESGPARLPDREGVVVRDGVPLAWASYGDGPTTVVLMPAWSIVNSRMWKAQVPYLARHYRVVTFDGRGSGRSGRPRGATAYTDEQYAADTVAVLDDAGVDRAVLVGLSCGASWAIRVAAEHPDRVHGIVAIGAACGFPVAQPERDHYVWSVPYGTYQGWAKYNKHYWLNGGYEDFVRFFMAEMFPEPHSTKQIEDATAWGLDVEPEVLVATTATARSAPRWSRCAPWSAARCWPSTAPTTTCARTRSASGWPS
jgi:pimeloyl-ACP methyl ester carboxylesterase